MCYVNHALKYVWRRRQKHLCIIELWIKTLPPYTSQKLPLLQLRFRIEHTIYTGRPRQSYEERGDGGAKPLKCISYI